MSSIQERIRKLQSLDSSASASAPPPGAIAAAKERLTHQASLPTSVTSLSRQFGPSTSAAEAPAARVSDLARAVEHTSLTSAPRLGERAAAFSKGEDADDGSGGRVAGKIIDRLEAGVDKEVIADRVRRLEKDRPGVLGKGRVGAEGLTGRRAAFEREAVGGIFQQEVEETPEPVARKPSGVRDRAGLFEQGGVVKGEGKQRGGLLDRKGLLEPGEARKQREEEVRKEEAAAREAVRKEEETRETRRREEEKAAKTKAGSLSSRAAMFEGGGAKVSEGGQRTVSNGAAKETEETAKKKEMGSLLNELQEVKSINKDLVSRLVELTGAFKRLEKSREELQTRVSRLEKK